MTVLLNPDCLDGKHRACAGDGWCEESDHAVPCPCVCHQPALPPPLAYLPCCGATVKLTRTTDGYTGTETHTSHCPHAVAFTLPKEDQ